MLFKSCDVVGADASVIEWIRIRKKCPMRIERVNSCLWNMLLKHSVSRKQYTGGHVSWRWQNKPLCSIVWPLHWRVTVCWNQIELATSLLPFTQLHLHWSAIFCKPTLALLCYLQQLHSQQITCMAATWLFTVPPLPIVPPPPAWLQGQCSSATGRPKMISRVHWPCY